MKERKTFKLMIVSAVLMNTAVAQTCSSGEDRRKEFNVAGMEQIGSGGYGTVEGNNEIAIKTINLENFKKSPNYEDIRSSLEIEIAMMVNFQDLSFVSLLYKGCFLEKKENEITKVHLKMSRYETDLYQFALIQKKGLSDPWKLFTLFKIFASAAKLHLQKICHQDFKE